MQCWADMGMERVRNDKALSIIIKRNKVITVHSSS
jgi:hypothetical protein